MTPERYRRLMELFDRAPAAGDERTSFLAAVRDDDPALADELRALLAEDGARGDLLDSNAGRLDIAALVPAADTGSDGAGAGTVVADRYVLAERLGSGAAGHVYRARDRATDSDVAIKLLRANLVHEPHQVVRFRREFRAISRIDHPGCLKVFAEGLHGVQRYIVMEYVAGGNLGRLIGADNGVLLPVLVDIAEALDCVHGRRIIHRDLKPANVLLAPGAPARPKLADFGIVKLVEEATTRLTETGTLLGTIDYMAPEVLAGKPLDPRADLYSLGCVMFVLWAGRPPFGGAPFERMRARLDREPPGLRTAAPHAPAAVEELVARLLDRSPARRPRRASDVARELRAIAADVGDRPRARSTPRAALEDLERRELPPALDARSTPVAPPPVAGATPVVADPDRARAFHDLRAAGLAALLARDYASARHDLGQALGLVEHLAADVRSAARTECTELLADALAVTDAPRSVELLRGLAPLDVPAVTRGRWLRKLGVAMLRTRDLAGALATLQQGLAVLGETMPRRRVGMRWRIVRDVALTLVRRALGRRPGPDAVREERAMIHRELAMMHRWIDLDRAAAHQVAFVRLAHRLGGAPYLIDAYASTAFLQAMRSWPRLAGRNLQRARSLALGAGDVQRLVRLEVVCGATEVVVRADEDAACVHFDRGVELAEGVGDRFLETFARSLRGAGAALLGRWRQAADDFRRAGALAAELDVPWLACDAACGLAAIEVFFGRFDESSATARRVLASDERMVLPALEAVALEVLAVEALLRGRFRDALVRFDAARHGYAAHDLYRGWGVLTKLGHCEAALCLADEQGADAVPDLLERLRRGATYARRRLAHLPLHRGHELLLHGAYAARRGDVRAAQRHFARLRAVRAAVRPGLVDMWIDVRLAFERRRLGEPREELVTEIDELARTYEAAGLHGICAWIARMRQVHQV
jgi:hypothetical protein